VIGGTLGLIVMVGGPLTGGSFNPARSLDPVLYNQEWGDVWIYIVGPLAGGVLGAAIWSYLVGGRRPAAA
jgi:glycerol uptake facilitator-like aquaporin